MKTTNFIWFLLKRDEANTRKLRIGDTDLVRRLDS